jgi:hypothetical protein
LEVGGRGYYVNLTWKKHKQNGTFLTVKRTPLQRYVCTCVVEMTLELLVDGVGDGHILEHALQLGSELAPALGLQFGNHHLLRIV